MDYTTNPVDVYAVQLFYGQQVTFHVTPTTGTDFPTFGANTCLFDPSLSTIHNVVPLVESYASGSSSYSEVDISYMPAVTGVYYLAIGSGYDNYGLGYRVSVSGSESTPSSATTWTASPAAGFSTSPISGHPTWIYGAQSPSFTTAPLTGADVDLQESTDTVHWTLNQSLSGDGIYNVSVAPTSERWYRFYYAGDDGYAGSTSTVVDVRPLLRTSMRAWASVGSVKSKRRFTILGTVTPAEAGDGCGVYVMKPGKHWTRLAVLGTNSGGSFSLRTSFRTKGVYRIYLSFYGSTRLAASVSNTFKVKVK